MRSLGSWGNNLAVVNDLYTMNERELSSGRLCGPVWSISCITSTLGRVVGSKEEQKHSAQECIYFSQLPSEIRYPRQADDGG